MISLTQNRRAAAGTTSRFGLAWRAAAVAGLLALAGCQEGGTDSLGYGPKHLRPIASATQTKMRQLDMSATAPILIRLYKEESEVEVWKQDKGGKFALLETYPICKWSGKLGPKIKEGDRQAPEGFYTITPGLMNPRSSYHLAFNTGFPNAYDRSLGRNGTDLMVHGACSSRGCYAMTDRNIQDIYALGREAFRGGQRSFQLQAFPFRMTPENLAKHDGDPNMPFWMMLKEGSDHFEVTRLEPKVDVCGRRYVFDAKPTEASVRLDPSRDCPVLEVPQEISIAVASKRAQDEVATRAIVAELAAKRKREEENRARDLMIASFLGAKGKDGGPAAVGAPTTDVPAGDPAAATQIMIASVPVPQAAPGRAPAPMTVAAAEPAADKGSAGWFASVFSFTDPSTPPVTAAATTPAPTQTASAEAAVAAKPAAASPAAAAAQPAAPPASAAAVAVPVPAASPVAAQPVAAPIAATPAPPTSTPSTTTIAAAPAATDGAPMSLTPEPAEEKSILAKAWGSLFSTN